ncbi:MAG: hydrogenase maturation protease [Actinomycetota bacterium]
MIGIGNAFRRDDGVGPAVVEALGDMPGVVTLVHHGEGTDLMERWQGCARLVLVDASCSGAPAGTVGRWDASAVDLPAGLLPKGSHVFGVAEGIALARRLGKLPASVVVIGIEGKDFTAGQGLSPAVAAAVPDAVALAREALLAPA